LEVLTSGISVYAKKYSDLGIDEKRLLDEIGASKTLFSKDGWTSHVTVREYGGVRSLLINGKADGSDGQDLQTELLSAHLPLLLHPNPKKVFVLGLGTGITLRAIEKH
jgi:spermidine synthase